MLGPSRQVAPRSSAPSAVIPPVPRPAGAKGDAAWLVPLLALFVVKSVLLVAMVGPFTGHDEVDHFWYVARLSDGNGLGVVGEVDLPPEAEPYADYVADYPTNAEVIQPPLYHALLVPLYLLAPGDGEDRLLLLRLVSVPLGAAVVWIGYLTARLLFPRDALLRAGVPIFVALQPQFGFVASIVNHDILVILLVSLALYLALREVRDGGDRGRQWAIGLIGAAGLWTKASFALVLPVVGLALLLAWRDRRGELRDLVASGLRALGLPLLLASPWFLRSFLLYGDPTGSRRLREVSDFGEQAQGYRSMLTSGSFWRQLLEDFWGNYGWRQVPLDPVGFRAIWLVWAVAGVGLAVGATRGWLARRRGDGEGWTAFQRRGVGLVAATVALFVYGVLYVGTIQFTQARFAFPAMIGFGTLTLLGVGGWLPTRFRPVAVPLLAIVLAALNAVVVLRFLLPFYYGPGGGAFVP